MPPKGVTGCIYKYRDRFTYFVCRQERGATGEWLRHVMQREGMVCACTILEWGRVKGVDKECRYVICA